MANAKGDPVSDSLKTIKDEVARLRKHFTPTEAGKEPDPRAKAILRSLKAMDDLTDCGQTLTDF